jgi:hypothetical protein
MKRKKLVRNIIFAILLIGVLFMIMMNSKIRHEELKSDFLLNIEQFDEFEEFNDWVFDDFLLYELEN